jgi:hypothetical protein
VISIFGILLGEGEESGEEINEERRVDGTGGK